MSNSTNTEAPPASTLNSLCERFRQWLDGIFTYYNTEFWKRTTKVRPRRYCKERGLPSKKGGYEVEDKDYVVVPVAAAASGTTGAGRVGAGRVAAAADHRLEQKYLNGYPNGAGKRRRLDAMV